MKTGELSSLLGVDKGTLYNWSSVEEVAEFLSPGALGEDGAQQRTYTQTDVDVLNTIRHIKAQNRRTPWEEIIDTLKEGIRITEYPTGAMSTDSRVISVPHAEQSAKVLALMAERDNLAELVENLNKQVKDKDDEIRRLNEQRVEDVRKLAGDREDRYGELYTQVGKLQAKIEMLEEELGKKEE